ncbi:MAG TPA: response regulator transcription factor [Chitinophagaceae bacterium]|nr:response regulator transcription factor [Chitinophagaceae bacterium]
MEKHKIALADDHILMRKGLASLIDTFEEYKVIFQGANGQELINSLNKTSLPHIVLLDINMPKKDGYETAYWLKTNYPEIKILALSMYDNEVSIIRMLQNGARGYILKDAEPSELKAALDDIWHKGYYYSELVTGHLIKNINKTDEKNTNKNSSLTDREIEFLKYCCTEMGYKEIADKMFVSPRTVENYRDSLFEKLNIKTRVGLAMYAMKSGFVNLSSNI